MENTRLVDRDVNGRFVRGHHMNEGRGWDTEQLSYLRRNYSTKSNKELNNDLKKTIGSISTKARKLGLKKNIETIRRSLSLATRGRLKPWCKGKVSFRRGLSLQAEYGLQRATEIKDKCSKNSFWKGKTQPLEVRLKKSLKLKGTRCGDKNPAKRPEVRKKIAQTLSSGASSFFRFKDHPEWRKKNLESTMKRPTIPEEKVSAIINEHTFPFSYTGNGKVIIGTLNPDFLHLNSKKIIEVFGRVFHDPSVSFKIAIPWHQQYFGRMAYYAQFGYDCLILWDDELCDESVVVRRIQSFLKEKA